MMPVLVGAPEGASLAHLDRYITEVEQIMLDEVKAGNGRRIITRSGSFGSQAEVNNGTVYMPMTLWDEREETAQQIAQRQALALALRAVEGELTPEEERKRAALAPWTRVNNCTPTPTLDRLDRRHIDTGPAIVGTLKRRRPKLGRLFNWKTQAGGPSTNAERAHHEQS